MGDITYIPAGEGWLYLAVVKDLCLKKVVGYAFSDRIDSIFTINALNMVIQRQKPKPGLIFHSDRSVQYASAAYRQALDSHGFCQSMSRKSEPYDHAVAENFFFRLKGECVYSQRFATRDQAKAVVFRYSEAFYNPIRSHSGIGWLAPNVFESRLLSAVFASPRNSE